MPRAGNGGHALHNATGRAVTLTPMEGTHTAGGTNFMDGQVARGGMLTASSHPLRQFSGGWEQGAGFPFMPETLDATMATDLMSGTADSGSASASNAFNSVLCLPPVL